GEPQPLSPNTPTIEVATGQEAFLIVFDEAPMPAAPPNVPAPPPQPVSRDTQTATGSIRGRVLGHEATPLAGATVQVTPGGDGARHCAIPVAAGRYDIRSLPAGQYRARVTKSGLVSVEYGQSRALQPGRVIDLGPHERLQG